MTPAATSPPHQQGAEVQGAQNDDESQPFPPPLVPETLQYRLETGNIGGKSGSGQRGSLTRCAQKFGTLYSKVLSNPSSSSSKTVGEEGQEQEQEQDAMAVDTSEQQQQEDEIKKKKNDDMAMAKNDLTMELDLYLLEATKVVLNQQAMQHQVEQLTQEQDRTSKLLEQEQASIHLLQGQVARAKETRNCQLEYEALAKLTNDKFSQPKRVVEHDIDTVQNQLHTLKEELQHMEQEVQVRDSQFQLLLQYLLDLKRSIQQGHDSHNNNTNNNDPPSSSSLSSPTKHKNVVIPMQIDEEDEGLYGDL